MPQCRAHSRSGAQCRRRAIAGGAVCPTHGGSIKRVKAAAARRLAELQARSELGRLLGDTQTDLADAHPISALTEALARARAMTTVLGALVGGTSLAKADRAHPLAAMYADWVDKQARIAKAALDAGIDERRMQLADEQARVILDVFRAVFADPAIGFNAAQRSAAGAVAARHLRAIEGGVL
jgi:hypothetical protein